MMPKFDQKTGECRPKFRTPYDGVHIRQKVTFSKPSRTKQEFKDQCDVNQIVANFTKTGRLDQLNQARAMFLDLAAMPSSYQESLNLVLSAREAFEALPSDVRALYGNDVHSFLAAAQHDPEALFEQIKPVQRDEPAPAPPIAQPPVPPPETAPVSNSAPLKAPSE